MTDMFSQSDSGMMSVCESAGYIIYKNYDTLAQEKLQRAKNNGETELDGCEYNEYKTF